MAASLVLVGLMGTGKSTIAKEFAKRTGRTVFDTDRMIETNTQMTVRDIFTHRGEAEFRRMETDVLAHALSAEGVVIAAAGGVVVTEANRLALRDARQRGTAKIVWLRARPDVLVDRTSRGSHRPLLDRDPVGALQSMAETREHLYREVADVVIDTDDKAIDEIVELLVGFMNDETEGADHG